MVEGRTTCRGEGKRTGSYQPPRFILFLIDITPPVLQSTSTAVVFEEDDPDYAAPVVTATDGVDGDMTSSITTTGSVDKSKPGTYTLVYSAKDAAGNIGTLEIEVQIIVGGRPFISLNGKVTMDWEAGVAFVDPLGTITDSLQPDLDVHLNSDANTAVNVNRLGVYNVTYSMAKADNQGYFAEPVVRTVIVKDTQAPVCAF